MKLTGIGRRSLSRYAIGGVAAVMLTISPASGQVGGEEKAAIAVAGSALAAITQGDMIALTDLMLPEPAMFPTSTRDGVTSYRVRTRAEQPPACEKHPDGPPKQ